MENYRDLLYTHGFHHLQYVDVDGNYGNIVGYAGDSLIVRFDNKQYWDHISTYDHIFSKHKEECSYLYINNMIVAKPVPGRKGERNTYKAILNEFKCQDLDKIDDCPIVGYVADRDKINLVVELIEDNGFSLLGAHILHDKMFSGTYKTVDTEMLDLVGMGKDPMLITKFNAPATIISEKLIEEFKRHGQKPLKIPTLTRIKLKSTSLDDDGERMNVRFGVSVFFSREELTLDGKDLDLKDLPDYVDSHNHILFQECGHITINSGYVRNIIHKKIEESIDENGVEIDVCEMKMDINKMIQDEVADILKENNTEFEINKVQSFCKRQRLGFLDFSNCDSDKVIKHKTFFELVRDRENHLAYVAVDASKYDKNRYSNDEFYDLLCIEKDGIPVFVPVPIVMEIMGLTTPDIIWNEWVDNATQNNEKVYIEDSDEFVGKYKTFFKLRSL